MNEKNDLLRSEVINTNTNSKFDWVKEFVFSTKLEKFVALAGVDDELFLVDMDGKIVDFVENA